MIIEKIKADSLHARKTKHSLSSFLITLLAEIQGVGKSNGNRETTEEEAVKVMKKFLAGAEEFKKSLTPDDPRYDKLDEEIAYLKNRMPAQLSEAELTEALTRYSATFDNSVKNMGKIMGALKTDYPGLYDGALASKILKTILR